MSSKSLFCLGQSLRGAASTYKITKQVSEFIYFASYVGYLLLRISSASLTTTKEFEK